MGCIELLFFPLTLLLKMHLGASKEPPGSLQPWLRGVERALCLWVRMDIIGDGCDLSNYLHWNITERVMLGYIQGLCSESVIQNN